MNDFWIYEFIHLFRGTYKLKLKSRDQITDYCSFGREIASGTRFLSRS